MDRHKQISLGLAVVTALLLASIGVFIAEENIIGIIGAIAGATLTTGTGFMLKKRWNRQNE